MDRRAFIASAVSILAAPCAIEAQSPGKVYRIGYLAPGSATGDRRPGEAFREGLRELGWVEGQNIVIESRLAEGRLDRLPDLAAELVRLKVDVIAAATALPVMAAKNATTTIPIVMLTVADPVGRGFVASLARPGGNVTGVAYGVGTETFGKGLELLKEAVPRVRRVGVLSNPDSPGQALMITSVKSAARSLGLELRLVEARGPSQFDASFAAMAKGRVEALLVVTDPTYLLPGAAARLADLAVKSRAPVDALAETGCRGRRPHVVRAEHRGPLSPRGGVRGQDPQGRQARRPPRRAAHEVRAGDQPAYRQGAGRHDPARGAGAGGRGDPVMDRREFLGAVSLGLLAESLVAEAQEPGKVPRIGILLPRTPSDGAPSLQALLQGLRELGWVEGQNMMIEYRWAEGRSDRLPGLAAELVRLKVDVIHAGTTGAAMAAKNATSTIPIVMATGGDPVTLGLVASLARPGGNVTGLSYSVSLETVGKQLELLKEVVPKARRMAVLSNPTNPSHVLALRQAGSVARSLGLQLQPLEARGPDEFDRAFATMARERAGALFVMPDPVFGFERARLQALAVKSRLPAMYGLREFTEAGGLMSYAPDVRDNFRRSATYVDRILKGAKPADLPVEQPTKFELVINLKTAKALGLTIPPAVLARADEVIE